MPGALTEHRIEAQTDEQGDEREDNDGSQCFFLPSGGPAPPVMYIVALTRGFKGGAMLWRSLHPIMVAASRAFEPSQAFPALFNKD